MTKTAVSRKPGGTGKKKAGKSTRSTRKKTTRRKATTKGSAPRKKTSRKAGRKGTSAKKSPTRQTTARQAEAKQAEAKQAEAKQAEAKQADGNRNPEVLVRAARVVVPPAPPRTRPQEPITETDSDLSLSLEAEELAAQLPSWLDRGEEVVGAQNAVVAAPPRPSITLPSFLDAEAVTGTLESQAGLVQPSGEPRSRSGLWNVLRDQPWLQPVEAKLSALAITPPVKDFLDWNRVVLFPNRPRTAAVCLFCGTLFGIMLSALLS